MFLLGIILRVGVGAQMGCNEGISGLGCSRTIPLIHNKKLWSKNKHVFISAALEIQKKKSTVFPYSRFRDQGRGLNKFYHK